MKIEEFRGRDPILTFTISIVEFDFGAVTLLYMGVGVVIVVRFANLLVRG